MDARLVAVALTALLAPSVSLGQQPSLREPLYPGAAPPPIAAEPLPPPAPSAQPSAPASSPPSSEASPPAAVAPASTRSTGAPTSPPLSALTGRVFCEQPVTVRLAERDAVAEPYRPFIGIWSDASWSPLLCAALIVANVTPDGTASIVYVFGPMGSNARGAGGVLHGTGIIRDGELRFQNSDGSQFAFHPLYADLDGHLTTPRGQNYHSVFKKTR